MSVQYVGNLWFNFPPRLEMEPHHTQKANAIVIPVETWLRICMHRRMDDFPALAHAAHTWTEEGGRVFVLVKRLRVGKRGHINGPDDVHNDTANDAHTCRSFIDNVSKMRNLTELVLRNVVIPSSIVSLASKLRNLRELSLEGVCIAGADVEICREDVEVEHVRLLKTCWHGRNGDGDILRACKKLKTLEISWDKKWKDANKSCEEWSSDTCECIKIYSNRRRRAAETDYMVTIVQDDEVAAHSRMLGALKNIRQLKVNICDDVIETDDVLGSIADMLDFNPPIEKLTIAANDTLRTNISHEHFRKFQQMCGGLQQINIGDRVWTSKQGYWNEIIGE
ncbi:hypothetical protein EV359DRAFT_69198 [Lentinula novae-zelandiae]|nr:hypothetical protein EV359DRAFT_69198 [Lentinula novae-zelandiae]